MSTTKQIVNRISNKDEFFYLLERNPGLVLLKFGATWCGPCKVVDPIIYEYFNNTPDKVICASLDIDDNFELYGYFKKSRVTNGIPVVLCYSADNKNIMPTDSITGSNKTELINFFNRVSHRINILYKDSDK
jgi:thiol-disulfide isomerase/thioredoxin